MKGNGAAQSLGRPVTGSVGHCAALTGATQCASIPDRRLRDIATLSMNYFAVNLRCALLEENYLEKLDLIRLLKPSLGIVEEGV